ncbi:Glycoside hydrolase [Trema orientale]|uniref:Glycoside hydrolase n=1 Tax=Trema orientale TaxID=63057 RepID=A0A2P5ESS7_TREOI|nr:Glycoside hydrolase [Trema orientale]
MAEELCALFQTFDLWEIKEHFDLESALEKYRSSLRDFCDVMDTSEERVDQNSALLFLYMDCPIMATCLARNCLVFNNRNGRVRVTSLPPYLKDVTFYEICKKLRALGGGVVINYDDPMQSAYFAALVPSNRFQKADEMTVLTFISNSLVFDVYTRRFHMGDIGPYSFSYDIVAHGYCVFRY